MTHFLKTYVTATQNIPSIHVYTVAPLREKKRVVGALICIPLLCTPVCVHTGIAGLVCIPGGEYTFSAIAVAKTVHTKTVILTPHTKSVILA